MLYTSVDKLQKKVPSKYTIVTVAAKRARQIQDGKRVKVTNPKSHKPVGKALEELYFEEVSVTNQPQD